MPKITQGNRLYFYRLFMREIGTGNQVRIARFEEVLNADGIFPEDCECESLTELLENLGEFVKITTFKKGRVFATLQTNAEYDEALEKAALPQDDKDVRAGKSWKRKKAGKVPKPTKPRHKPLKRPKPVEPPATDASPSIVASPAPEVSPAPEAQGAPEPAPTAATSATDGAVFSAEKDQPREAAAAMPELQAEGAAPATRTDAAQPGEAADQAAGEAPDEATGEAPGEGATAEAPEPSISLTITYDPREDESVADLYPREDELPAEGSFSFEEDEPPAEEAAPPAPGIPRAPAGAIPHQSGFPRTISADVSCKDAMLGLLYEVLPMDVDPMGALDEAWLVARSTSTLAGSRSRVTFPLRYLHEKDGLPVEVTIAHVSRSTSGKRWELVSVNGVDATWEGTLAQTQAPAVGGAPEPLGTLGTLAAHDRAHAAASASDPERELAGFAHLGSWDTALAALAEVAAPERWSYPGAARDHGGAGEERALLRAYLAATFHRVRLEGKVAVSADGTFAAFDTGLLAPMGESVYACLSARDGEPSWGLEGFCVAGAGELGARLADKIDVLPERASYLANLSQVALARAAQVDADVPALLRELGGIGGPGGFGGFGGFGRPCHPGETAETGETGETSEVDERELALAIERSVTRAKASFRVGTPAYDAPSDEVRLLVPLCPLGSARACGAIVLSAAHETSESAAASGADGADQHPGRYRVEAIVSLERAYACARVISQEQPRWLSPAAEE